MIIITVSVFRNKRDHNTTFDLISLDLKYDVPKLEQKKC